MAAPISDAVVVDVLRRVDRGLNPLAQRLGRPPRLSPAERAAWWADQVSRVAAGVSAAPRFAGKLADLLPLQNTVGSAVQALVVLGVAGEHGLDRPADRVSLLARVLLDRDLPADRVQPLLDRSRGVYVDEALGEDRSGARGVARSLWRAARLLSRIDDALDARPKGKLRHRALAQFPVVGVAGGYAAERQGLRRAALEAEELLS
ncbi:MULTISPECIES: hypothetical protein [unclassified Modestobacter]|uniref:hypothetical protein n=1 Tax=unclassified Modestobacter TaxID=2643866 RepID=UPI0022AA92AE|nr:MULTISPECIES: hypothetical protein [unclassified Modestobacter]MCZ2824796.1 hypothetical protein [Modestobacter sp. VKM Ac-2981]MCZ2854701.1 hypothetical protein [Modestobacter sp. VKM Ac-2982]